MFHYHQICMHYEGFVISSAKTAPNYQHKLSLSVCSLGFQFICFTCGSGPGINLHKKGKDIDIYKL